MAPEAGAPAGFLIGDIGNALGRTRMSETSKTASGGKIYCVCGGEATLIQGVLRCSSCLRKLE